jgi:hypothetical protein
MQAIVCQWERPLTNADIAALIVSGGDCGAAGIPCKIHRAKEAGRQDTAGVGLPAGHDVRSGQSKVAEARGRPRVAISVVGVDFCELAFVRWSASFYPDFGARIENGQLSIRSEAESVARPIWQAWYQGWFWGRDYYVTGKKPAGKSK